MIKSKLKFLPPEISSKTFECSNCKCVFSPDWLAPKKFPAIPIEAKDGGHWVPATTNEKCPKCKQYFTINLPKKDRKGDLFLFGDEAFRPLSTDGSMMLYTYSLVGTSKPLLSCVEDQVRDLKSKLIPNIDPDSWAIHMKDIWSGSNREKRPHLASWTRETTEALFDGAREIFTNQQNMLFKYNIMFYGKVLDFKSKINLERFIRDEVYSALLMFVIDMATSLEAQPVIHFDSQKNSMSDRVIHQWAKDAFNSNQSTLLYPFISRGIVIPEPIFVPPASKPLLELADIMSFCVARFHYLKFSHKLPDIDLSIFGKTNFLALDPISGDLLYQRSIGYPWK